MPAIYAAFMMQTGADILHRQLPIIFEKLHGKIPPSHWITYEESAPAIRFVRKINPENIFFIDYEPHHEFDEICKGAKRIGIFGHHEGRTDIDALCKKDSRVVYFNPRHYLPEKIKYTRSEGFNFSDRNPRNTTQVYERGVPITYPLMRAKSRILMKNKIFDYSNFVDLLGLRAYGYKKLWEELSGTNSDDEADELIGRITLLSSYRLDYSDKIVSALTKARSPSDAEFHDVRNLVSRLKLARKKNLCIENAIHYSKEFLDLQIFPIVFPKGSEFQIIKTFVSDLDKLRQDKNLMTTVCVKCGPRPKCSIRTDRNDINLASLLAEVYSKMPPETERNYGAHPKAAGFIANGTQFFYILHAFINAYFWKTTHTEPIAPIRKPIGTIKRLFNSIKYKKNQLKITQSLLLCSLELLPLKQSLCPLLLLQVDAE